MPTLKVVYRLSTKEAQVLDAATATPGGFVDVGTFVHPDATYPDSKVIYHGVRDLLYLRSAANPANPAMFPDNINNMQEIAITLLAVKPIQFLVQPAPRFLVPTGSDVVWSVQVAGGKAPLVYKWYYNDILIDALVNTSAATPELINHAVEVASAGVYHCTVTDADGTVKKSEPSVLEVVEHV